jgi:hypothetical protein
MRAEVRRAAARREGVPLFTGTAIPPRRRVPASKEQGASVRGKSASGIVPATSQGLMV